MWICVSRYRLTFISFRSISEQIFGDKKIELFFFRKLSVPYLRLLERDWVIDNSLFMQRRLYTLQR